MIRRQSEIAKQRMMAKARMESAIREIKRNVTQMIERARPEVYTTAYTSLEATFGEQPEEVLLAIDKGIQESLKQIDSAYMQQADKQLRQVLSGHEVSVRKHDWNHPQEEELGLVQSVRNEIIDVMAQYAYEFICQDHDRVIAWVKEVAALPQMQPAVIIQEAKKRWKEGA